MDLNTVITDVMSLLEHQFAIGSIKIRRELWGVPVPVFGIEHQLQQVFLNLFLNARDAMPSGGWLTASTRIEGGHVVAEVADTGSGSRRNTWRGSTTVLHDEGDREGDGFGPVNHVRHSARARRSIRCDSRGWPGDPVRAHAPLSASTAARRAAQ